MAGDGIRCPALDNLRTLRLLSREELACKFNVRLQDGFLLVTYHPVTLEYEHTQQQVSNLLAAIEASNRPALFTMANADTHGRQINSMIRQYVATHPTAQLVENFGMAAYFSVMSLATAMVGNSSSGIIEAASWKLPVVNVGNRQLGRFMPCNVVQTGDQQRK